MDELRELEAWYLAQCNGDWEHEYEIRIGNLDNPGWTVSIPLADTDLQDVPFAEINDMAPVRDWLHCWVEDDQWRADGGPLMLTPMLRRFLDWAAAARSTAT
jgi:hypothetical protein